MSRKEKSVAFLLAAAALLPHPLQGQEGKALSSRRDAQDAIVFSGTTSTSGWRTDITVGNPTQSQIYIILSYDPNSSPCNPLLGCPAGVRFANPPPNGSGTEEAPGANGPISTTYATGPTSILSTVSARITRTDRPEIGVDIPAVRLSSILAANPKQLLFAGARQGTAGRSNLVLTNVRTIPELRGAHDIDVRIDAFAADGTFVGSLDETLIAGQTLFIGQVLSQMGVSELPTGTLRVTVVSGDGVLWGVLYSVDAAGSISATVGANL